MPDVTITVSDKATEAIRNMKNQAIAIEAAWKNINPEYGTTAMRSLAHNLAEMFSSFFGATASISWDSDLSLYVSTPSIHYGVIFHGKHYGVAMPREGDVINLSQGATLAGRYCMHSDGHQDYCAKPWTWRDAPDGGKPTCDHNVPPIIMPIPGDWSFHS